MALRDFPNNYFAWYNDDRRLAIVEKDTTSTDTSERTKEKYDTFQSEDDVANGLRVTFHSKYEEVTAVTNDLKTHAGVDSALHNAVLCYVKSRLLEDIGDLQKAQYFTKMFQNKVNKHKGRRSGVRALSVPRL